MLAMGRSAKHGAQAERDCLAFLASAGASTAAGDGKLQVRASSQPVSCHWPTVMALIQSSHGLARLHAGGRSQASKLWGGGWAVLCA